MAYEEIFLDNIEELSKLLKIICYPSGNFSCFIKRVIELKLLGLKSFLKGDKKILNFPILGKGTTSIVLKGKYITNKIVTVKIRRVDSNRESVIREAKMLKIANTVNVGPELITFSKNFIIWNFIDGIPLNLFLKNNLNRDKIRKIIKELMYQAYKLDKIGLVHLELSRPINHILITKEYKPVIIDFETASIVSSKKNLSQILNFLLFSEKNMRKTLGLNIPLYTLRKILHEYKSNPTRYFDKILALLDLE